MAKLLNKNNHKEMILARIWSNTSAVIDDEVLSMIDNGFSIIKKHLGEKIYGASMNYNRLKTYDESVYVIYRKLMESYIKIIDKYMSEERLFKNQAINNIYTGVYSVLMSRIKLYEENIVIKDDKEINLIMDEKKQIVIGYLKQFGKDFDSIYCQFKSENKSRLMYFYKEKFINDIDYNQYVEGTKYLEDLIIEKCGEDLYDMYLDTIKEGINSLNDLDKRQQLSYHIELIREEFQILSTIVKVQIGALEEYLTHEEKNENTDILNKLLVDIKEIYQRFGKDVSIVLSVFDDKKYKNLDHEILSQKESMEQFEDILRKKINTVKMNEIDFDMFVEKFKNQMNTFYNGVYKNVNEMIETYIKNYNLVKDVYKIKQMFSLQNIMTNEVVNVFADIDAYMINLISNIELTDSYEDNTMEILKGINETISIKVESIEENEEIFKKECTVFTNSIMKEKVSVSDKEIKELADVLFGNMVKKLIKFGKDDRRCVAVIKQELELVYESELVETLSGRLLKLKAQRDENALKKISRFNKENLLFELTTFEEINNYSISVLRNSSDIEIKEFVEYIDDQIGVLETILKKNNIQPIKPKPYDKFNAKEHEVLIAEENENFKKGDIIKLMNTGYKQDDSVIIRANVVAAR